MSDQITLRAETGRATGSRESRRLRREGNVPAVIYGRGIDPIMVAVDHHDLMSIIQHQGTNAIITVEFGSESHVTMPKVIERHPYRNLIRHVDFLKISLDEVTTAEVAVELIGEAAGAIEGGVTTQVAGSLHVSALPMNIPASIEVDVTGLGLNESLRVADLVGVEGVEFLDDPDTVVAAVAIPRAVVEDQPEEAEGEEVAEGEEGQAEGGESGEAEEDSGA